jgi:hypothetical protein
MEKHYLGFEYCVPASFRTFCLRLQVYGQIQPKAPPQSLDLNRLRPEGAFLQPLMEVNIDFAGRRHVKTVKRNFHFFANGHVLNLSIRRIDQFNRSLGLI